MSVEDTLNRIFDRLGNIDAKLESGSQRHAEFSRSLADLDGKVDGLTDRIGEVEGLAARIQVIEPTVWQLEGNRRERQGQTKLVKSMFKTSHALVGVAGAGIAWLVHQVWPSLTLPWK